MKKLMFLLLVFHFLTALKLTKTKFNEYFLKKECIENGYEIINIYKRKNPTVYTQGLYYKDGFLYESGGLYGKSTLTKMKWPSQEIVKTNKLDKKYFGEGIAASKKLMYQLTWKEGKILYYSFPDMKYLGETKMPKQLKEGWGLTDFSEDKFYATDGSNKIYSLKKNIDKSLSVTDSFEIKKGINKVNNLNDLTFDGRFIFCNVYLENIILKIFDRRFYKEYNMNPLVKYETFQGVINNKKLKEGEVLNGITYIPESKTFLVTGKNWEHYYEIAFK